MNEESAHEIGQVYDAVDNHIGWVKRPFSLGGPKKGGPSLRLLTRCRYDGDIKGGTNVLVKYDERKYFSGKTVKDIKLIKNKTVDIDVTWRDVTAID